MNTIINSDDAPKAIGPYSQAIETEHCLYVSGCIGIDPKNGELKSGIKEQAIQAMDNLVTILKKAGLSTKNIVKTTCFISDMNDFGLFNEIYASYFSDNYFPARSCVEVSKLPKGALIEVEAIASIEDYI